jgi:hypothetical protein
MRPGLDPVTVERPLHERGVRRVVLDHQDPESLVHLGLRPVITPLRRPPPDLPVVTIPPDPWQAAKGGRARQAVGR